jgi:hypothetical protein
MIQNWNDKITFGKFKGNTVKEVFDKEQNGNDFIADVICCGVLENMKIEWMVTEDGIKCMPFIYGKDQQMYRVNKCPSCGADVRNATI